MINQNKLREWPDVIKGDVLLRRDGVIRTISYIDHYIIKFKEGGTLTPDCGPIPEDTFKIIEHAPAPMFYIGQGIKHKPTGMRVSATGDNEIAGVNIKDLNVDDFVIVYDALKEFKKSDDRKKRKKGK